MNKTDSISPNWTEEQEQELQEMDRSIRDQRKVLTQKRQQALELLQNKEIFTPHEAAYYWCGQYNAYDIQGVYVRDYYEGLSSEMPDELIEMAGEELSCFFEGYRALRIAIQQQGLDVHGNISRESLTVIAKVLKEEPEFLAKAENIKDNGDGIHHLEKQSLYKIIAALLKKLHIEPTHKDSTGKIVAAIHSINMEIESKTVRKHMKGIDAFLAKYTTKG